MILAIDPGPTESAFVLLSPDGTPKAFSKVPNGQMFDVLDGALRIADAVLAIEVIASYGMPVGGEIFTTCEWVGRFTERWRTEDGSGPVRVYRRDVKLHLCNSARAKDSNVRQALIDLYGGKDKAIGRKAAPGPLYGMKDDEWAALGVATTAAAWIASADT